MAIYVIENMLMTRKQNPFDSQLCEAQRLLLFLVPLSLREAVRSDDTLRSVRIFTFYAHLINE